MNNQLQALLLDSLLATNHVKHAAIFRRKDVLLRAYSDCFTLSKDEMEAICNLFTDTSETRTNGINLKGTHYKTIRADKYSVYGKRGGEGVVVTRTVSLVVVATYTQQMCASICVEAVERMADYFREKGK